MHLQNGGASAQVRQPDHHLAVEAPRAQQGGVEDVGAVGGGDHDDPLAAGEAVHLNQELIERLFAFVVTAAEPGPAAPADGVDLVDKDDAGGGLLGLFKQIAYPRGAHADEHLHEVRARDAEEGDLGLAGDCARQQGLAGPRRAYHQDPVGDVPAEVMESLRAA